LLKAQPDGIAELLLAEAEHVAPQAHARSDMQVNGVWGACGATRRPVTAPTGSVHSLFLCSASAISMFIVPVPGHSATGQMRGERLFAKVVRNGRDSTQR
jgi:hypothetical protein